jgi:hypothetical protein
LCAPSFKCLGRDTLKILVFISHPGHIFISEGWLSARNFLREMISFLGIGSPLISNGIVTVLIAKRIAAETHLWLSLIPSAVVILSSI